MKPRLKILAALRFVLSGGSFARNPIVETPLFRTTATRCSTSGVALECRDNSEASIESYGKRTTENEVESAREVDQMQMRLMSSVEVLRKWGCKETEVSKLLLRRPVLQRADGALLESKLNLLSQLGITSSDLVKIINCRPRFLSSRIDRCFDKRIEYFTTFFGSKEMMCKAIIRNPTLMIYDLHEEIKPVIEFYKGLGLSREDLILMMMSRPTLIPRTSFNSEKMEYVHKIGVSSNSKMFKYIVCLIGISRIETIQEKVANLEKFGLSEKEVLHMIGKAPLILTLSVEKVRRNMTYLTASMKLPPHSMLPHPCLLFYNLEARIRPRMLICKKIEEMNLKPQMKWQEMLAALRKSERSFLKIYVMCYPKEVADELMDFYKKAKGMKRLAEKSKKIIHRKGFPF